MGIELCTKNASFGCSYTYWNELRIHVIIATIKYINDKFEKDKAKYGHLTENDKQCIGEGSTYSYHMKNFNKLIKSLEQGSLTIMNHPSTLNLFVSLIQSERYRNAVNYFDIGGIISFCENSDCDGYYTPGNSLDIRCLFDKIKPFTNSENTRYFYYSIYGDYTELNESKHMSTLYDLFEDSYKTLCKVIIS
jgi:hypothetical protein